MSSYVELANQRKHLQTRSDHRRRNSSNVSGSGSSFLGELDERYGDENDDANDTSWLSVNESLSTMSSRVAKEFEGEGRHGHRNTLDHHCEEDAEDGQEEDLELNPNDRVPVAAPRPSTVAVIKKRRTNSAETKRKEDNRHGWNNSVRVVSSGARTQSSAAGQRRQALAPSSSSLANIDAKGRQRIPSASPSKSDVIRMSPQQEKNKRKDSDNTADDDEEEEASFAHHHSNEVEEQAELSGNSNSAADVVTKMLLASTKKHISAGGEGMETTKKAAPIIAKKPPLPPGSNVTTAFTVSFKAPAYYEEEANGRTACINRPLNVLIAAPLPTRSYAQCTQLLTQAQQQHRNATVSYLRSVWSFLMMQRAVAHTLCSVQDESHPSVVNSRGVYRQIEREEALRKMLTDVPSVGHVLSRTLLTASVARLFLRALLVETVARRGQMKRVLAFRQKKLEQTSFRKWKIFVEEEKERKESLVLRCLCHWMVYAAHQGMFRERIIELKRGLVRRKRAYDQIEIKRCGKVFRQWRRNWVAKREGRRLGESEQQWNKQHPRHEDQDTANFLNHYQRYMNQIDPPASTTASTGGGAVGSSLVPSSLLTPSSSGFVPTALSAPPPAWLRDSIQAAIPRSSVEEYLRREQVRSFQPPHAHEGTARQRQAQHEGRIVRLDRSSKASSATPAWIAKEDLVQCMHAYHIVAPHNNREEIAGVAAYPPIAALNEDGDDTCGRGLASNERELFVAVRRVKYYVLKRWRQQFEKRCDGHFAAKHCKQKMVGNCFERWRERLLHRRQAGEEEEDDSEGNRYLLAKQPKVVFIPSPAELQVAQQQEASTANLPPTVIAKLESATQWRKNNLKFSCFQKWKTKLNEIRAHRFYADRTQAMVMAKWVSVFTKRSLLKRVTKSCFDHWRKRLHQRCTFRVLLSFRNKMILQKHFTAWRALNYVAQHSRQHLVEKVFLRWKENVKLSRVQWFLHRYKLYRAFSGWRLCVKMTLRKRTMEELSFQIHRRAVTHSVFGAWKEKFVARQIYRRNQEQTAQRMNDEDITFVAENIATSPYREVEEDEQPPESFDNTAHPKTRLPCERDDEEFGFASFPHGASSPVGFRKKATKKQQQQQREAGEAEALMKRKSYSKRKSDLVGGRPVSPPARPVPQEHSRAIASHVQQEQKQKEQRQTEKLQLLAEYLQASQSYLSTRKRQQQRGAAAVVPEAAQRSAGTSAAIKQRHVSFSQSTDIRIDDGKKKKKKNNNSAPEMKPAAPSTFAQFPLPFRNAAPPRSVRLPASKR